MNEYAEYMKNYCWFMVEFWMNQWRVWTSVCKGDTANAN